MNVELIAITPNAEALIARCARVSHRAEGKGPEDDQRLIRKLVSWGHLSVLEHAQATFLIEGISRACLGQLTRHRHLSYTVESGRYTEAELVSIYPPTVNEGEAWREVQEAYQSSWRAYRSLLDAGIPREDARFVLPLAMPTRLTLSGNFRSLYEFCQKRMIPQAQWEIRELAERIHAIMADQAPSVFAMGGG